MPHPLPSNSRGALATVWCLAAFVVGGLPNASAQEGRIKPDRGGGSAANVFEGVAGSTWGEPLGGTITLERDGSIRHSDPQFRGTWGVMGRGEAAVQSGGAVAVVFEHGWVGVWRFDRPRRAY